MLPTKVREQAERADALHRELYGNTEQPAPVAEGENVEQVAAAPVVEQTPPVEVTPPVAADSFETQYRVLKGKYDAEVPRMAEELREAKHANRDLQAQVEKLREEMTALKQQPAAPAAPRIDEVEGMSLDDVKEQFGEEFAKAVGAVARQYVRQSEDKFREEFVPKLDQVERHAVETARETFLRRLGESVPDYAEIDRSPEFTAFLDEVDPLSGRARRTYFEEANNSNDAARIAKFFLTFKATTQPPQSEAAMHVPSQAIEAMVQPSTSRVSEVPKGKKFWTRAEVQQFYVDVRKGRYTPTQAKAIESDMFAAQRENRFQAA
jgi:hypothetical protein